MQFYMDFLTFIVCFILISLSSMIFKIRNITVMVMALFCFSISLGFASFDLLGSLNQQPQNCQVPLAVERTANGDRPHYQSNLAPDVQKLG